MQNGKRAILVGAVVAVSVLMLAAFAFAKPLQYAMGNGGMMQNGGSHMGSNMGQMHNGDGSMTDEMQEMHDSMHNGGMMSNQTGTSHGCH